MSTGPLPSLVAAAAAVSPVRDWSSREAAEELSRNALPCVDAYEELAREGIAARVVSMPSWELFEQQDQAYRDSLLPPEVTARVSVEQASVIGWDRYVGMNGAKIGMHTFGSSAPLKDLLTKFGFTPDKVVAAAKDQIAKSQRLNS